uniref:G-protein coupled receptors family 1 profile domain-containing protein n=1 Tax=Ciona savignyi TaxID=51511 RepID=H2YWG0_CIOSA
CSTDGDLIKPCIHKNFHCDQVVDCADRSDEWNCSCGANKYPCGCFYTEAGCNNTSEYPQCYDNYQGCNGLNDCNDWSDEENCMNDYECDCHKNNRTCPYGFFGMYKRMKCDRFNDCGDWADENNCGYDYQCDCHKKHGKCPFNAFGFYNQTEKCDGYNNCEMNQGMGKLSWKCKHGFDELNCTNRFYCKNGDLVSISSKKRCDGIVNCYDGLDELKSICKNRRFFCVNGSPTSVGLRKVENGIRDCSDGSDECPANSKKTSIFSSPFEMIKNPFLRAIIWLMGLVAMFGNSVVFVGSLISLRNRKDCVALVNHLFILNLSFSDFLMSVYLFSISIKGVMFSGTYCYHDLAWRSGSMCSFLGALVVISTEASALTMTMMTTFRLLTVRDPIGMMNVSRKIFPLTLILVWIISFLLGTIPLINYSSGFFVSSLWFPNHFYSKQSMSKADINQLIQRI